MRYSTQQDALAAICQIRLVLAFLFETGEVKNFFVGEVQHEPAFGRYFLACSDTTHYVYYPIPSN